MPVLDRLELAQVADAAGALELVPEVRGVQRGAARAPALPDQGDVLFRPPRRLSPPRIGRNVTTGKVAVVRPRVHGIATFAALDLGGA